MQADEVEIWRRAQAPLETAFPQAEGIMVENWGNKRSIKRLRWHRYLAHETSPCPGRLRDFLQPGRGGSEARRGRAGGFPSANRIAGNDVRRWGA